MSDAIPDISFRCPTDLAVTPLTLRRVAVVGQCLLAGWPGVLKEIYPKSECDLFLFNNLQELPAAPPRPVGEYDFQTVAIPLRSVVPETAYFTLNYNDVNGYAALFDASAQRLRQFFAQAMRWNRSHGLLTFVVNFLVPQQNPLGRLLPRYDLRNFVYFVERLNQILAEEVAAYTNAYLFDLDQVVASMGRRHVLDDVILHMNHGAVLSDSSAEADRGRIEPATNVSHVYPGQIHHAIKLSWIELLAMFRTTQQLDMVKLVVTDIDDTIWRGVAAETTTHGGDALEGWPLGYIEALCYLKRRGVLLAVLSKNEESLLEPIWRQLLGARLPLDNFAVRKINWRPKVENFAAILEECNVLPQNVVFIDDNPVERASIVAAYPRVRAFGPNPHLWRRILLWSPETQVPTITTESAQRTAMIHSQVERETQRKVMSREEFLASLKLEVLLRRMETVEDSSFPRALELTNKSNQFNTTGQRWTPQEIRTALAEGLELWTFEVTDRFTSYGLVGVVFAKDGRFLQFLMSCRVVGLEVEVAVIAQLTKAMARADRPVSAELKETELNLLARDVWRRCGFELRDGVWRLLDSEALRVPAHVSFV